VLIKRSLTHRFPSVSYATTIVLPAVACNSSDILTCNPHGIERYTPEYAYRIRHLFSTVLKDPLSDVTRKERVYLLTTSTIGIAIVKTGLAPSRITTLGIEFEKANQNALLLLLGIVVGRISSSPSSSTRWPTSPLGLKI
jgi:hypothetical protein